MMDITINTHMAGEVAFFGDKSYIPSEGFVTDEDGYWISQEFLYSPDFRKIFVDTVLKLYPEEFKSYLLENKGFSFLSEDVNGVLDKIHNIDFIKSIAKERDGFVNSITLPKDENGDFLDGDAWDEWAKKNCKPSDIIFVKCSD